MPENKPNIHEGHRKRVKERFLRFGIESFTDVQLLEALLFYAVPKKDTNDTAHLLLDTFGGTFAKVLNADFKELIKVKGVGENAASLIKLVQMLSKKYLISSFTVDDSLSRTVDENSYLCQYCANLFLGCKNEMLYAIALDDELIVISHEVMAEGDPGKVDISDRKIVEFVLKNNCKRVALAHNHPNSSSQPSREDVFATNELSELLAKIDVELVDHIIVGKYGAVSMRDSAMSDRVWRL